MIVDIFKFNLAKKRRVCLNSIRKLKYQARFWNWSSRIFSRFFDGTWKRNIFSKKNNFDNLYSGDLRNERRKHISMASILSPQQNFNRHKVKNKKSRQFTDFLSFIIACFTQMTHRRKLQNCMLIKQVRINLQGGWIMFLNNALRMFHLAYRFSTAKY